MATIILKRALIALEPMGEFFQTVAQAPFQIEGIGVWGARPGDFIERMQIGPEIANASVAGYVPVQFYSMDGTMGYAELARRLEAGELLPLTWGPDYFLHMNTMMRIRLSPARPELLVAIWGYQLIAYSPEDLANLPQNYYEVLDRERDILQKRIEQIDAVKRPVPGTT